MSTLPRAESNSHDQEPYTSFLAASEILEIAHRVPASERLGLIGDIGRGIVYEALSSANAREIRSAIEDMEHLAETLRHGLERAERTGMQPVDAGHDR